MHRTPATAHSRTLTLVLIGACVLAGAAGCKKSQWIKGKWLHVDENGKPGMCYEFAAKKQLSVYRSPACDGPPDPLLSGKWQLKEEHKLAVLRESEGQAHLALIIEHDEEHFVARSALAGSFHRLGEKKPQQLFDQLRQAGTIKVFPLDGATECKYLGRSFEQVSALAKEDKPRMLRARDQGLVYHSDTATGDPTVDRIVFALNQEQVDWIAFHLKPAAFAAPGPAGRLEARLGAPSSTLTTGKGEERQTIAMWNAYCAELRGAFNKNVDVTLFSTPGKQEGMYYVSEGVVANLWEDLRATVASSPPAEDEESGTPGQAQPAPAPAKAPAPAPAPAPTPEAAAPAPAAPPAPAPAAKKATEAKGAAGGRLAVPGDEDL